MTKEVYVSHPIAGREIEDVRELAHTVARRLDDIGLGAALPLDVEPWPHDGPCPRSYSGDEKHTAACYLRADLAVLLTCDLAVLLTCDALLAMPGWPESVGCREEVRVAHVVGIPVYFLGADWTVWGSGQTLTWASFGLAVVRGGAP